MKKINVLLADDHAILRKGIRVLLDAEKDIKVVGEAENGRQALELSKLLSPEVVIMDISMPILNGTEATRQILDNMPDTKVIILSAHGSDENIEQVVAAGASGYLMKITSVENIAKAIREVCRGNTFFESAAAKRIYARFTKSPSSGNLIKTRGSILSLREREVLQLVAEGMANKEIAGELKISVKTVEKHRQQLKMKLQIHDTAGLTRYAISTGVIYN
ncbi:MAG: response regulator transcription factor [Victivallales bacterium]